MNRFATLSLAASLALKVLFAAPPVAAQSPPAVATGFINGQVTANGKTMLYKWVAAVQAAGNTTIQYTEFPGVGHNVWDMVYDTPDVIKWLLAQKR